MNRTLPLLCLLACAPPQADDPVPDDTQIVEASDPAPDTDPPIPTEPGLSLGPEVVCADPALRQTEGPFFLHEPGGDWADQTFDPRSRSLFVGGSVAVADIDGDGWLDLVLTDNGEGLAYYGGQPDLSFVDRSDQLPVRPPKTSGATAVDLDGDTDLDLVITVWQGPNLVLRNDGAEGFVDIAAELGLAGEETVRTMSSSWGDLDGDGDLDGFVAAYGRLGGGNGLPGGDPSMLVFRDDDGTYVDVVPSLAAPGALATGHTFMATFTDVEGDGDQDLYLVNDFGWRFPSMLLRNDGTGVVIRDRDLGNEFARENMGAGIADVDHDGTMDILVSAWDHLALFESEGPIWFNNAEARGLTQNRETGQHVAWGSDLVDVDNDGDHDATVVHGFLSVNTNNDNPRQQPDGLWLKGDDDRWTDVAPAWGLDQTGWQRGFVWADLDRDGWLDLIKRDLRGPTTIHRQRCGAAAWIGVHLRQDGPNPFAVGARVEVTTGGTTWLGEVRAGGTSYASAGPPEVHVGLGSVDVIDTLTIRWPDGVVESHAQVPTRRWVTVRR